MPHDGHSSCNHDHGPGSKHSHGHGHGHGHHHHHHHAISGRVGTAFALNLFFAIVELVGGFYTNSLAVMSDALHDFGDSLALGMAWWLEKKSQQKSDASFTYGYRRFSVVSAFATGVILVSGSLWILSTSIPRIFNPEPVLAPGMLALGVFGILVNGAAFFRLSKGSSLNERMLSWHFIEDLLGWVFVLFGAGLMMIADVPWVDPLMAALLSCWVLYNVVRHLKQTMGVFLQASPAHLRHGEVQEWIKSRPGVEDVHHTHIWSLDGEQHILTAHVVVASDYEWSQTQKLKNEIKQHLREKFSILEVTIEFECSGQPCLDPEHATDKSKTDHEP